jgi:hypothetical protein
VARNTLANANAVRNWRIYAEFAQRLMASGVETAAVLVLLTDPAIPKIVMLPTSIFTKVPTTRQR